MTAGTTIREFGDVSSRQARYDEAERQEQAMWTAEQIAEIEADRTGVCQGCGGHYD